MRAQENGYYPGKYCLGAICGDYIGSRFEFDPVGDDGFELIYHDCFFTDDSILSLAVEEAVLGVENPEPEDFERAYRKWHRRFSTYPQAGWGAGFDAWARGEQGARTTSFGNGAIMRVSAVANVCLSAGSVGDARGAKDTGEADRQKAIEVAYTSCMPSHAHPRSISAATTLVELISYAREGKGASELLPLARHRGYDVLLYEQERRGHGWTVDVKETLEAALSCLEGTRSYEEAVTKAINLRGDADTTAAVVGSLAEHIWGIPDEIRSHVSGELVKLLDRYPDDPPR
jgi:type I restriction enzyme M protein